jgi:hypothetical protein
MINFIRPNKTPTLKKRGFVIVGGKRNLWIHFDQFFRYPGVLLLMGFLLSGVLGSWLTYEYQERERDREATVQNMNELRDSIDDFVVTYNDYAEKVGRLIVLIESNAPPEKIALAQTAYDEMVEKWRVRYSVDAPSIRDKFQNPKSGRVTLSWIVQIQLASLYLDECMKNHAVVAARGNAQEKNLLCTHQIAGQLYSSADSRYMNLTKCVAVFEASMRPSHRDDFLDERDVERKFENSTRTVSRQCRWGRLMR